MKLELAKAKDSEFGTFTYCCTDFIYKDHLNCAHHIYICIHEEVQVCCDTDLSGEPAKFISHAKPGQYNQLDITLKPQNNASPPKTILSLQMRRGAMSNVGSKRKRPNILDVGDT